MGLLTKWLNCANIGGKKTTNSSIVIECYQMLSMCIIAVHTGRTTHASQIE